MFVRLQLHLILITRKCFYPCSYPSYPFLMCGITTLVIHIKLLNAVGSLFVDQTIKIAKINIVTDAS